MAFSIRPSRDSDLAAVDALLARSYPKLLKADYPPSVLVTALPIISRARPELVGCGTYYVAEEDGRIIGAGGWTRDSRRAELGHIRHVVTDDRALRRGVGRAILGRALAAAQAAGIQQLECWSTRTAEAFYAAMGFISEAPMEVSLAPAVRFLAVRKRRHLR